MNIDQFINMLELSLEQSSGANLQYAPNFRTLSYMADCFRTRGLPVHHIGKISIMVSEDFWLDAKKAKRAIEIYCDTIVQIERGMEEEFGSNGRDIFIDSMQRMCFKY